MRRTISSSQIDTSVILKQRCRRHLQKTYEFVCLEQSCLASSHRQDVLICSKCADRHNQHLIVPIVQFVSVILASNPASKALEQKKDMRTRVESERCRLPEEIWLLLDARIQQFFGERMEQIRRLKLRLIFQKTCKSTATEHSKVFLYSQRWQFVVLRDIYISQMATKLNFFKPEITLLSKFNSQMSFALTFAIYSTSVPITPFSQGQLTCHPDLAVFLFQKRDNLIDPLNLCETPSFLSKYYRLCYSSKSNYYPFVSSFQGVTEAFVSVPHLVCEHREIIRITPTIIGFKQGLNFLYFGISTLSLDIMYQARERQLQIDSFFAVDLNDSEFCIIEYKSFYVINKLTGTRVLSHKLAGKVKLLRQLGLNLVAYVQEYTVRVYDRAADAETHTFKLQRLEIQEIVLTSSSTISVCANDQLVHVYDLHRKKIIQMIDMSAQQGSDFNYNCQNIFFLQAGVNLLLTTFVYANSLQLWNTHSTKCIRVAKLPLDTVSAVCSIPHTNNKKFVVAGFRDIFILNVYTGRFIQKCSATIPLTFLSVLSRFRQQSAPIREIAVVNHQLIVLCSNNLRIIK